MAITVDKPDALALGPTAPREKIMSVQSIGQTSGADEGSLPLPRPRETGHAPRSPDLDSLTSMMKFRAGSAALELAIAEVIEALRNTNNVAARSKIDLLMENRLSLLKEKQERIELAQQKFEEAQSSEWWSGLSSKISFILSAAVSVVLIASGIGSGLGTLMLAALTVATLNTVNQGLATFTGEGLGGSLAEAFGADKGAAQKWDMAISIVLGIAAIIALLPAGGALAGLSLITKGSLYFGELASNTFNGLGAIKASQATDANAERTDLIATSKEYEALIQQLSNLQQQDADNLVAANNRANEMMASLMRTITDVNNAFARVRFTS